MGVGHVRPVRSPCLGLSVRSLCVPCGFGRGAESEGRMGCIFCDALVVLPWWEVSLGVGRLESKPCASWGFSWELLSCYQGVGLGPQGLEQEP